MRFFMILCVSVVLQGCGGSDDQDQRGDKVRDPVACAGFSSPRLLLSVTDSMSDTVLDDAIVNVYINGDPVTDSEAVFDDSSLLYVSNLLNWNGETISFVVARANYESFVVKNLAYEVDASCGAVNDWTYEVFLCPSGTACL